jgi:hypothetical protein
VTVGAGADDRFTATIAAQPGDPLRITVTDGAGNTSAPAAASVPAVRVTITEPAAGATVAAGDLLVRGTVSAPPGVTLGVSVNGVPAVVEGDQFAALVPVDETVARLTATASDLTRVISTHAIAITVLGGASPEPSVQLLASVNGGVAPLTVGFELSSLVGVSQVALDADGNGAVDVKGPTLDGQTFTYSRPGIYVATVRVTDDQNRVHTAVALVQVSDPAALDARLQAVWQGFKDALKAGTLPQALAFLHRDTRAAYEAQLSRFSPGTLANIDQYLTTIRLVEVGFGGAQYEMLRVRDGQTLSFAVWFQVDQDGVWRLRRF